MLEDVVSMGHNELIHSMADLMTLADSGMPRTPQLAVCTEIMRSCSHQLKWDTWCVNSSLKADFSSGWNKKA